MATNQHDAIVVGALAAQPFGWCAPVSAAVLEPPRSWPRAVRSEFPGYLSMVAFLLAYALVIAGVGSIIQTMLNLGGGLLACLYLLRKGAVPSVIGNAIWVFMTLVGFVLH